MEAMTLPRQLLVTVDGGVNLANVRRAISMLKGVTKVKAQKVKAASKREQSQAMEQREQKQTCLHSAESRQSSRNSNCLSSAERKQARTEFKPRLYDPETGEYLNDKTMKAIEDVRSGKDKGTTYSSFEEFEKAMRAL